MKLIKLEEDNTYQLVKGMIDGLAADNNEPYKATFDSMADKGYGQLIDTILITRYYTKELLAEMAEEAPSFFNVDTMAEVAILTYLKERAPYFKQCLQYEAATYNPIENYSQTEHEETESVFGERYHKDTHIDKPYTFKREHDYVQHVSNINTPQIITEQYTDSDIVTEHEQVTDGSTETKVAPNESSEYFNKEKVITDSGKVKDTEKAYNIKSKTPQHTITTTEQAHKDSDIDKLEANREYTDEHDVDAATDITERDLTRSGNIGVQTAAQMMMLDSEFWKNHRWLSDICLDIVKITCETVVAL